MKPVGVQENEEICGPAKILAVDDDAANLIALQETLGDLGQPIVCVRSGEDALRHLLEDDFAIILLDVRMPGMDGYETAALIRGRMRCRHVPIIFLSAVDKEKSHLFRGYAAGAVDYVFKPIEPVVLRAKVNVFLDLHLKAQEIRRQAEQERRLLEENLRVRAQQLETSEALKRTLAQQALVIDALPVVLYVSSITNGLVDRRFVGGHLDALIGAVGPAGETVPWLKRAHPDDAPRVVEAFESLTSDQPCNVEYRIECADGKYRWVSDHAALSRYHAQEQFGILLDISDRRLLEEQLAHAQKLEALGEMTGGIAHDFNNMLTVVIGSLNHALSADIKDTAVRKRLDLAKQAAWSCADLTKRLLKFARRQVLEPKHLDLVAELSRLRELIGRLSGGADVHINIDEEVWPVFVDSSQLESAIVNLVINARDAMPAGGQIHITAANLPGEDPIISRLGLTISDYVELSVADTGDGIPPEIQSRVFEPFFTTKAVGRGTGLGLSMVYGFARQSGGTVIIDSAPGRGTTVSLYLRKSLATEAARGPTKRPSSKNLEGCHVLLVEDENNARELAKHLLEDMGCVVSVAENGDVAVGLLEAEPPISLLFTDCTMPGDLDGPGLAIEARRRFPGLPVLFTSGVRSRIDSVSKDTRNVAFLSKPYTSTELNRAISILLNSGCQGG